VIITANELGVSSITLEEIFATWPGNDFVWACCSEIGFLKTGGDRTLQSSIGSSYSINRAGTLEGAQAAITTKEKMQAAQASQKATGVSPASQVTSRPGLYISKKWGKSL
jgi:hypothetical protein